MKPSFALNLSHDSVTLLHRTPEGWSPVGTARFDGPDPDAEMAALRSAGEALAAPGPLACKVVIPASEVKFTVLTAPAQRRAARRAQIAGQLDGLTPYSVEELAFDWSGEGPDVAVAIVARETLAEAEGFAARHGFGPLGFAAAVAPGQFEGEAWFGPAAGAAALLPPGEKVERDHAPVGKPAPAAAATPPVAEAPVTEPELQPEPVATPEPVAQAPAPVVAVSASEPAAPVIDASEPAAPGADAAVADAPAADAPVAAAPEPAAPEPAAPEPATPAPDAPAPAATEPAAAIPESTEPAAAPQPDEPAPEAPAEAAPVAEAPAAEPVAADSVAAGAEADLALTGAIVARAGGRDVAPGGITAPGIADWTPEPPAPRGPGQRPPLRLPELDEPAGPERATPERATPERPPPDSEPGAEARKVVPMPPRVAAAAARSESRGGSGSPPVSLPSVLERIGRQPGAGKPGKGGGKAAKRNAQPDHAARSAAASLTPPPLASGSARVERLNPALRPAGTSPGGTAEAASRPQRARTAEESLNRFGAPKPQSWASRYLVLILTGALIAVLAAVALWAGLFLDSARAPDTGEAEPAAVAASQPPAEAAPATEQIAAPAPVSLAGDGGAEAVTEIAADPAEAPAPAEAEAAALPPAVAATELAGAQPTATTLPETSGAPQADTPVTAAAEPAAPAEPRPESQPAALPEPAPARAAAGAGAASSVARAPATAVSGEVLLSMRDAPLALADAVTLPAVAARGDAAPRMPAPPPPFGTVYRFDAAGNIIPTPEGVITPEGVRLVAGPPPRLPPPRPAAAAAAVPAVAAPAAAATETAAPAVEPAATATAAAEPAFPADPALAGARPRSRPPGSAPAPDPVAEEEGALPPPTDGTRFASLKPRLRPASIFAAAEARRAEEEAERAALAAVASAQAVAISRRPALRPRLPAPAAAPAVAEPAPVVLAAAPAAAAVAAAPAAASTARPRAQPTEVGRDARSTDIEDDGEPEVVAAARSGPTRATVARQATMTNAIDLDQLNLIGVYGTPNNRHALVRQANGRYLRVKVGDRLDGGRVAAIGQSELQYEKGGRRVKLAMPRG
jgi:hypothetical protein